MPMRNHQTHHYQLQQHDDSVLADEDGVSLATNNISLKSDLILSTSSMNDFNASNNTSLMNKSSTLDFNVDSGGDDNDFNSVMSEMSNFSWGEADDAAMSLQGEDEKFEYLNDTTHDTDTGNDDLVVNSSTPLLIDNNHDYAFNNNNTSVPVLASDASSFCTAHSSMRPQQEQSTTLPIIMEPRCTIEQLARQAANLSIEEKVAIQQDIFGVNNEHGKIKNNINYDSEGNQIDEDECIDDFYSELEMILARGSKTGKFAYGEALIQCPKVVDIESNPLSFLRCENYNPKKAALRLIEYWEMRKEVFGEKRAFLPMSLKAGGAMEEDRDTIDKYQHVVNIIPDDNHGRTVIYFDRTNVDTGNDPHLLSALHVIRYVWYIIHIALLRKVHATQINGCVLLFYLPKFSLGDYDGQRTRLLTKSLSSSLPVKIRCIHTVIASSFFGNIILPIYIYFLSENVKKRIQIHSIAATNDSSEKFEKEKLVTKLVEQFGFNRNYLPQSLGGNYKMRYDYKT